MKTNPWFVCVVVFELERSCKIEFMHTRQVYQQDTKAHKTSFLHKPLSRKTSQIIIKTSVKIRLVRNRTMVNKSMAAAEFKP